MDMRVDNRPIGVFDSGLGGLTAVNTLSQALPDEDICYLGDTGRVPYGGRSPETIAKYARQDIEFLLGLDIKAIVVACGTVSTTALDGLKDRYDLPIYGVLAPAVRAALERTTTGRVGVIGTEATVASGAFQRGLLAERRDLQIVSQACPLFVPLVENGRFAPGDVVIETIVEEYLSPVRQAGVDTLILGCTHYPLLEEVIGRFMGPEVCLISSGSAAAQFVAEELSQKGLLARRSGPGTHRYYVTDSVAGFGRLASIFLRQDVTGEVEKVSLDGF